MNTSDKLLSKLTSQIKNGRNGIWEQQIKELTEAYFIEIEYAEFKIKDQLHNFHDNTLIENPNLKKFK